MDQSFLSTKWETSREKIPSKPISTHSIAIKNGNNYHQVDYTFTKIGTTFHENIKILCATTDIFQYISFIFHHI